MVWERRSKENITAFVHLGERRRPPGYCAGAGGCGGGDAGGGEAPLLPHAAITRFGPRCILLPTARSRDGVYRTRRWGCIVGWMSAVLSSARGPLSVGWTALTRTCVKIKTVLAPGKCQLTRSGQMDGTERWGRSRTRGGSAVPTAGTGKAAVPQSGRGMDFLI